MTSRPLRSVAADANVLLSAAMGRAAQRVFHESTLLIVTTETILDEVHEYLARWPERRGWIRPASKGNSANFPSRPTWSPFTEATSPRQPATSGSEIPMT